MTKLSDMPTMLGDDIDPATDIIYVVDMSETGAARSKKMTVNDLAEAVAARLTTTADGGVQVIP